MEIGKWAMEEACRMLLEMKKRLPGVAICVNKLRPSHCEGR